MFPQVLKVVNESVSLLSFYNNVNAMIMFIPLIILSGEIPVVTAFSQLTSPAWWSLVILVGVFGFAIGYVTALQIQVGFRMMSQSLQNEQWFLLTFLTIHIFIYESHFGFQVTSPLTHNVSGTAKACAQTVLAVVFSTQVKTALWWTSNALVLVGSAMYTRVRQVEMARKHREKSFRPEDPDRKKLLTNV